MPLSDHEQRLLEQMERALSAEDPKLASALQGVDMRNQQRRRAIVGVCAFTVGLIMMFGGAVMMTAAENGVAFIIAAVIGFVVMLVSAYYVAISLRRMPAAGEVPDSVVPIRGRGRGGRGGKAKGRRPRGGSGGGFMSRMEERWRRRRDGGNM